MLAQDVWNEVQEHPTETLQQRIRAAITYLLGGNWLKDGRLAATQENADTIAIPPEWVSEHAETLLHASLLTMLLLALLGWRWSYPWRRQSRLAAIAFVWMPLPYLLSHAEALSGPRLPLDGVLLCYTAYAVVALVPGLARPPDAKKPK